MQITVTVDQMPVR